MEHNIEHKDIILNAKNISLGRLASKISFLLQGKENPSYTRRIITKNTIHVINASAIRLTGKKMIHKKYYHFSGYPGGIKEKKISDVMISNPKFIIQQAVLRMLPKNKSRYNLMKRLRIYAKEKNNKEIS